MNFKDRVKYNVVYETYGTARRLKAKWVRLILIVICLIIPLTNWLIPFISFIRNDLVVRW